MRLEMSWDLFQSNKKPALQVAKAFCVIAAEYSFGEFAPHPSFPEFV
jgi:hypothetical protein